MKTLSHLLLLLILGACAKAMELPEETPQPIPKVEKVEVPVEMKATVDVFQGDVLTIESATKGHIYIGGEDAKKVYAALRLTELPSTGVLATKYGRLIYCNHIQEGSYGCFINLNPTSGILIKNIAQSEEDPAAGHSQEKGDLVDIDAESILFQFHGKDARTLYSALEFSPTVTFTPEGSHSL